MKRTCRHVPLSKQPLVAVLCEVRFTPVRLLSTYLPAIQEEFRRIGFPIERVSKIQQFVITAQGPQVSEQDRWEYRTRDETWSVNLSQENLVLHTNHYARFEEFAERLQLVLGMVFQKTEHQQFGVVQRVGLRYANRIVAREGEDHRVYLRPGLHGLEDSAFLSKTHRLELVTMGQTDVDGIQGTMLVRVQQNDQGIELPPDLAGIALAPKPSAKTGELVTLFDLDHFIQGNFDANASQVTERLFAMHDRIVDVFHEHVVTERAIEAWK